jgi:hypothetical protein
MIACPPPAYAFLRAFTPSNAMQERADLTIIGAKNEQYAVGRACNAAVARFGDSKKACPARGLGHALMTAT